MISLETLRFVPRRVAWTKIPKFERFDERFGIVNALCEAIMDISEGHVELATNDEPTADERIAWVWLIRPDFGRELRELASADFRHAIDCYEQQRR